MVSIYTPMECKPSIAVCHHHCMGPGTRVPTPRQHGDLKKHSFLDEIFSEEVKSNTLNTTVRMGENTAYLPIANSPRAPLTPRSLRTRYALWLSIGACILATCALIGTICRLHMDMEKPNVIVDPFYKNDGVRSFLTVGRGRPRYVLP